MAKYSYEIIAYDDETGNNFEIPLNATQIKAIEKLLGIQLGMNENGEMLYSFFDDKFLNRIIADFESRWKKLE